MTRESVKKQPYIPLYIGDWEQDVNCISLQTEAAWLKIIFKMWKNGKSGYYKTDTKSLQKLWKTDTNGVQNIIFELRLNEVCDFGNLPKNENQIDLDQDIIIFINRRMVREAKISEIRSNAVQNRYKTDSKVVQPLENENEYETDNENTTDTNLKDSDSFGKSENLFLNGATFLVQKMHEKWIDNFPTYTIDKTKDFPACKKIADFIFRNAGVKDGFGNSEAEEKTLGTLQLIADQVNREPFWQNKTLGSIANNIQEFYNKIKNPPKEKNGKKAKPAGANKATREELNAKLNARYGRGGQAGSE